jgi:hypothetical protein
MGMGVRERERKRERGRSKNEKVAQGNRSWLPATIPQGEREGVNREQRKEGNTRLATRLHRYPGNRGSFRSKSQERSNLIV